MKRRTFWATLALAALAVLPTTAVAEQEQVAFSVRSLLACKDVTPKDFSTANKGQKLMEATFRISANFVGIDEKDLNCVVYKVKMPEDTETADFLPNTTLIPVTAGNVEVKNSTAMHANLQVSVQAGGKVGYQLPGLGGADAHVDGNAAACSSKETTSDVHADYLPPQQLVIAASTDDDGKSVRFKLRPWQTTTVEGEKVFAVLFIVPQAWTAETVTVEMSAYLNGGKEAIGVKESVIGLYVQGDDQAKKLMTDTVKGQSAKLASEAADKKSAAEKPAYSCDTLAGAYKGVSGPSYWSVDETLKKDGTWSGTVTTVVKISNDVTGDWAVKDGKISVPHQQDVHVRRVARLLGRHH